MRFLFFINNEFVQLGFFFFSNPASTRLLKCAAAAGAAGAAEYNRYHRNNLAH